jgi:hypothetical protein
MSCDEISHGLQRRKFEFLYKLNHFGTIFKEFTSDVTYFKDLELYEKRLNNLQKDVSKFETVQNWGRSDELKREFLTAIEKNLEYVRIMYQKQAVYREYIRNEYDVILMREVAGKFLESVDEEITTVGREK